MEWIRKALQINAHFTEATRLETLILMRMNVQGITPGPERSPEGEDAGQDLDAGIGKTSLDEAP
jgi:hypothetical protein